MADFGQCTMWKIYHSYLPLPYYPRIHLGISWSTRTSLRKYNCDRGCLVRIYTCTVEKASLYGGEKKPCLFCFCFDICSFFFPTSGCFNMSHSEKASWPTIYKASSVVVAKCVWLLTSTSVPPCMTRLWMSWSSLLWHRRFVHSVFCSNDQKMTIWSLNDDSRNYIRFKWMLESNTVFSSRWWFCLQSHFLPCPKTLLVRWPLSLRERGRLSVTPARWVTQLALTAVWRMSR